ncbi:MAG: tetratricopeptide repeat protein [Proteobacteria bacterium]|nr:tetratricopeptide repeat protein [Pseudomonadota bacterium]
MSGEPGASLRQAANYLQSGHLDLAARHLQSLLNGNPNDPQAMQLLGVVLFEQGNQARARELLQAAVRLAPDYVEALHNLALVLTATGEFDAAAAALRKAIRLEPENSNAWLNLGNAERGMGRFDEAAKAFAKASKLAPKNPMADLNQALLMKDMARLDEALVLFDKLIARYPEDAAAHNGRGACLRDMGRAGEAAKAHARAADLAPDNAQYRINMRDAWSRLIPSWHLPMLADEARNTAYQQAMDKHVREGMHVLDIGAGSGLLAMMAARAGAGMVTAVEMDPILADVARQIIADNGFADRIQVLNRLSLDLKVGVDLPPADLVVSEVLDVGLLGEGVLATLRHATRQLMKPGGRMVPAGAVVFGQLVELPRQRSVNPVARISGFDLSAFDRFRNPAAYRTISLAKEPHKLLSEPFHIADFDFSAPPVTDRQRIVKIPIAAAGEVYAVVFWFDLQMDEEIGISSGPKGTLSHWAQAVQFMDHGRMVSAGDEIALTMGHTDTRLYFSV